MVVHLEESRSALWYLYYRRICVHCFLLLASSFLPSIIFFCHAGFHIAVSGCRIKSSPACSCPCLFVFWSVDNSAPIFRSCALPAFVSDLRCLGGCTRPSFMVCRWIISAPSFYHAGFPFSASVGLLDYWHLPPRTVLQSAASFFTLFTGMLPKLCLLICCGHWLRVLL